jgi:hypothetical protein
MREVMTVFFLPILLLGTLPLLAAATIVLVATQPAPQHVRRGCD